MTRRLASWFTAGAFVAAASGLAAPAHAANLSLNLTGISSQGAQGASGNAVLTLNALPGAVVDNVSWTLNLTTLGASWLSEATILLRNSANAGFALQPGWGDDRSGSGSYTGSESLVNDGLSFNVLADGKLYVEFYETFDDIPGGADAVYNSGTLLLSGVGPVPEPGSWALMAAGLAGLSAARQRRRRA